ncbi:MAG: sulfate adenylyltransferase [Planctomycetes bacterium]|nr:sulfate adenylyltransferase [Planctomycetota bacterium]
MGDRHVIDPHGGVLVNRLTDGLSGVEAAATIPLSERQQCDLEMIAVGAMSPLTGFVGEADYHSICDSMTLTGGAVWPIPVTCAVDDATAAKVSVGDKVALNDDQGRLLGYLTVEEKYKQDKKKQAQKAYGTDDEAHPGVKVLYDEGATCLAGPIDVVTARHDPMFAEHRLAPAETRAEFEKRGWNTVVAFQTRNPIHRAHEYLTKCAQEITDGLLIHPLMGATKEGDIPGEVRMKCYQVLIEKYYHPDHTMLAIMPAAMRYAGPREAIFHAIYRQNYGCSHIIIGRDHAGVGKYYGTYDAQRIFDDLPGDGLQIVPLKFEHAAWSKKAGGMVSGKTFPKIEGDQIFLSGTKVRELLVKGERPPIEFTRSEVADILIASMKGR